MIEQELVRTGEILRGVVGSTAHGTAIEGQDDTDYMGVCIEPPSCVIGLNRPIDTKKTKQFEQYIYRTQPEGVRSGPGDVDLTVYSLRKWCRLAKDGNPTVILLLWLPEYVIQTELGMKLVEMRQCFVGQHAGKRFSGYLNKMKLSMKGERTKKVKRPELMEAHGYDTKYAMHALRLGYQGIEYMRSGRITLPCPEPSLSVLRDVRAGLVDYKQALIYIEDAEKGLAEATAYCERRINTKAIDNFLVVAYRQHWGW